MSATDISSWLCSVCGELGVGVDGVGVDGVGVDSDGVSNSVNNDRIYFLRRNLCEGGGKMDRLF